MRSASAVPAGRRRHQRVLRRGPAPSIHRAWWRHARHRQLAWSAGCGWPELSQPWARRLHEIFAGQAHPRHPENVTHDRTLLSAAARSSLKHIAITLFYRVSSPNCFPDTCCCLLPLQQFINMFSGSDMSEYAQSCKVCLYACVLVCLCVSACVLVYVLRVDVD